MALAENLAPEQGFKLFLRLEPQEGGASEYKVYSRFPLGGYLLIKLAVLPFGDRLAEQVLAARTLMLALFCGAAALAYLALSRMVGSRWIALAVVALAFSSQQSLYFADSIDAEGMCSLFGFMLALHGMAVFVQEGRFRQLLAKTGAALLLGWHVYALLLPFVAFELCGWLAGATRNGAFAPSPEVGRGPLLRRSRFLVLGAFALAFGAAVLGFNLLNERLALGASGSFADLPTFRSMMRRFGLRDDFAIDWGPFLKLQFHRIGRMSMPFALSDILNVEWRSLAMRGVFDVGWRSWALAAGVLATGGALLGLLLARRRTLLAVLALSGFCWALPMRHNTVTLAHEFESLYWIGVPLVFFSLALLGVRRLLGGAPVAGLAVAALAAFVLSSHRMGEVGHGAEAAEREEEVLADFSAIRRMTRGKRVFVPVASDQVDWLAGVGPGFALDYYFSGSLVLYDDGLRNRRGPFDFVLSRRRSEPGRLLTPGNRRVFLHEPFDIEAAYLSEYRRIVAEEPAVRSHFDLRLRGGELSFVRAPCTEADAWFLKRADSRFFLHVFPLAPDALPEARGEHGFDNRDFHFVQSGGRLFDGKCMVTVELPGYGIARIRTGQYVFGEAPTWEAEIPVAKVQLGTRPGLPGR